MANDETKLLGYLKRVTADLREAQRRLKDVEYAQHEPVAIIGIGCRFPGGVSSPDDLWDLVAAGREGIGGLPTDRGWDLEALYDPDPDHPGTSYVRGGGFLYGADRFDAGFFGIGPREAVTMAPQQRLALEVAWEAIEHARIDPHTLQSSATGTYLGCDGLDYFLNSLQVPEGSAAHLTTGNSPSVVAGRVAYTLGLEGAAVTLDTACSSSLVAIHLACQALRQGEVTLALAGGVCVMSSPAPLVGFSEMRAVAPDGRSKPFSADADGMTLAEGAGVVLLERLSDARRNGHRVLAVVRGTAVNEDGASNGLTAPNGPSQQRVIQQALANARLAAADVDAVEAHGTGTSLGDPIEAQALLATYGHDRPEGRPLRLGSIKSNIGHTQMAAGAAGVIKMVMALRHELLPRSLHIGAPNPHVDWGDGALSLLREAVAWPRDARPRRAGVSSFGFSGTNAHLILEEAPEPPPGDPGEPGEPGEAADRPEGRVTPWVVSARGAKALRGQARRLLDATAVVGGEPEAVGWSLATTRATLADRAVITGRDADTLRAGLAALAAGEDHPALIRTTAAAPAPGWRVFLFSGQGSQRPGMGAGLYERFPVFAAAFDEVCALLDPHLDHPLRDIVLATDEETAGLVHHTTYTQTGLFAVQVALARLLHDCGVRPDAVLGHSIGEIAAAHVAGVFSLEDACRLVAARATALGALPPGGAMTALEATAEEAAEALAGYDGQVGIAALNAPTSTVISGPAQLVAEVGAAWKKRGRKAKALTVSHAFHSSLMEPALDGFRDAIADLAFHPPLIPLISNLTGQPAGEDIATPDYWVRHIRQPVHFHPAVAHAAPQTAVYLEIGPDPVLIPPAQDTLDTLRDAPGATAPLLIPTLTRTQPDTQALAQALARLHTHTPVDWSPWFTHPAPPPTVDLPTYSFQRDRYWLAPARPTGGHGVQDPAEAELWEAIEDHDVETLAQVLEPDGEAEDIEALRPALPVLSAWRRRHRERATLASWLHRIRWTRLPEPDAPALSGTWLLLVPAGHENHPAVRTALQALTEHGADATTCPVDTATSRQALAERLTALRSEATPSTAPAGVLSLLALDEAPHPDHPAVPAGLAATLTALQALGDSDITAPLWCLTQGAVSTGQDDPLPHPLQAQSWGLGRVAALEHSQRWGGLVDLPVDLDQRTPARLAAVLAGAPAGAEPEDQAAIRTTGVLARRLVHSTTGHAGPGPDWRPRGTVLITGGTGGIGALLARWAAEHGAAHLVLISRRGPDAPGAGELAAELSGLGATVTLAACDAADREALRAVLDAIPAEHPLSTVIHAAGVSEHDAVADADTGHLNRLLEPKALAARHLHELTQDLDLSAFILFSSVSAAWGSGGQSGYAAANAYLDALADHRRGLGLPATSVAWGLWGEVGMATASDDVDYFRRRGLHPLDPRLAVAALEQVAGGRETSVVVAAVDWRRFLESFTALRPSPLLGDLPEAAEARTEEPRPAAEETDQLKRKLAGSAPAEQHHILVRHVQAHAAGVLGHAAADDVPPTKPFQELGFDSLNAVQLRDRLNASTALHLPTTVLFDYPSADELARHLHGLLVTDGASGEQRVMSELDGWDVAHAPDAVDEAARSRVAARLRLLADKWADPGRATGTHDDLETATAEEIFDLITQEFGKS
ncbi:type I polyketide synthase [Streptomyces sp. NPDC021225]|uniref:type I polyketide synthase n=1 Tax=Streptomyces sp. NPDC021225 TaxID=3365121 RepID=UPI0037A154BE